MIESNGLLVQCFMEKGQLPAGYWRSAHDPALGCLFMNDESERETVLFTASREVAQTAIAEVASSKIEHDCSGLCVI